MNWSLPIGTVKGTVIRVHLTFLLFLAWIGASAYGQGGSQAALEGMVYIVLLFLCVLLHEFGHVFAARRYGVQTPDIVLLPIGGVARLERIPEEPRQELVVALAGPAVNVVIAALLWLALGRLPDAGAATEVQNPGADMLSRLMVVNLFLVAFNLIPAFPMDGGRVLRAILASRMGYARGTQVAASVGQGVAFLLGLAGLFGNPMLLFVALFVYLGAASEAHAVQLRQVSRGLIVADAMLTRFESLGPGSTVHEAVEFLIRTSQHDFPLVDGAGRLRGVLTRDCMIKALKEHGPDAPVIEVMRRDIPTVHPRAPLEEGTALLQGKGVPAVGVVDDTGRLVGLLTTENVGELMMVQAALPNRAA